MTCFAALSPRFTQQSTQFLTHKCISLIR